MKTRDARTHNRRPTRTLCRDRQADSARGLVQRYHRDPCSYCHGRRHDLLLCVEQTMRLRPSPETSLEKRLPVGALARHFRTVLARLDALRADGFTHALLERNLEWWFAEAPVSVTRATAFVDDPRDLVQRRCRKCGATDSFGPFRADLRAERMRRNRSTPRTE